ncbi:MAG: metal-dependent phosphohydrolase, partial [Betaproteobacteria bacterium]|nr:metal-dependent phosphohydrolase [Betaproteobacteria bacterium]
IITGGGWLDGAREVVACHHEKWDGSGYPRGLVGEAIPLVARMFAIVDVFDALCSKRPYKDPLPLNEVMDVLQKGSGIHFDPTLLKVFSSIASKVYEATIHASEAEVRALMTKMVRRHFGN